MKKASFRGRRFFGILEWLLLHLTFIFSGMFIVLWIINLFNWQMEFLTSRVSGILMIIYFSTAFLAAGLYIVRRAGRTERDDGPSSGEAPSDAEAANRDPDEKNGGENDKASL